MARDVVLVQMFVSSPSDLAPERAQLDQIVDELNRVWGRTLGLRLEVVKWETHARPMLASRAQEAINKQVPGDYDIFLGMFWGRIGTATGTAVSGSVEELQIALARRATCGEAPEIMIYFKDTPISPTRIDPVQLASVHELKKDLEAKGIFYGTFVDDHGFEATLRADLSAVASQFAKHRDRLFVGAVNVSPEPESLSAVGGGSDLEVDELGFLDYIETYQDRINAMNAALSAITESTTRMNVRISSKAEELRAAGVAAMGTSVLRAHIRQAAQDMREYSSAMQTYVPQFSRSRDAAFGALSSALSISDDLGGDRSAELHELSNSLAGLSGAADDSLIGVREMRESIARLPRITSELNSAKRLVIRDLDAFILETEQVVDLATNINASIARMRAK